MYYVYVLRSQKNGHRYIGQTTDLHTRLRQHNDGATKSTRHLVPFTLEYTEVYPSRGEAMKRERFLKSGKGREWLDEYV